MRKRLEADLISIAHRILQLKNKSDINQLYLETQKLYEKLALLRLVDDHFGDSKPTIGQAAIDEKIEAAFEAIDNEVPVTVTMEEIHIPETQATPELISEEEQEEEEQEELIETEEPLFEEEEVVAALDEETEEEEEEEEEEIEAPFIPAFELEKEEESIEETPKQEAVEISFEELIGGNFSEDLFVKVESNSFETPIEEEPEVADAPSLTLDEIELPEEVAEPKSATLNEKLAKGIQIDLNDRIAFTKHLFGNDPEDYNRVLNQLITFNTYYETRDFIRDMVKPDYNNWEGKEEYEARFMEIIEKKFL
ncbi:MULTISPECIES: hypothetical protein [Flavobacterium]|uniref:DUF4476 domain-containing protein n=1 Tax=Flavobacterium keumense TaxID=1306518 RepID=A0ABY8N713_9FLAO|nr:MULTISPECIES: hypothetical protein [Flavobacterium]WGK95024.1 hypothetical protein MG292_02010 [Flavobacterium keumense]